MLRRIERNMLVLLVGFLPFAGICDLLISRFTEAEWVVFIPGSGWAGSIRCQWFRFFSWPCPNRGRAINTGYWFMGSFSRGRNCVHCGIFRFRTAS